MSHMIWIQTVGKMVFLKYFLEKFNLKNNKKSSAGSNFSLQENEGEVTVKKGDGLEAN